MAATADQEIVTKLTTDKSDLKEVVKTMIDQLRVDMSTIQHPTKVTGEIQGTNNSGKMDT